MTVMTECSAVNVIISSSSLPTVLPPVLVPRSPAGLAIDTSPSSSISPVCTPLAEEFSPLSSNPPSYGSSHTTMNGCVQASMLPGKGSSVRVRACVCGVCVCTRVCFHMSTLNWATQRTLACGTTSTCVRMCIQCSCARAYSIWSHWPLSHKTIDLIPDKVTCVWQIGLPDKGICSCLASHTAS